jgi:hypothetical protein
MQYQIVNSPKHPRLPLKSSLPRAIFFSRISILTLINPIIPTLVSGKLGLRSYSQTLSSDFANLTITR